jgi:hypothetical protein
VGADAHVSRFYIKKNPASAIYGWIKLSHTGGTWYMSYKSDTGSMDNVATNPSNLVFEVESVGDWWVFYIETPAPAGATNLDHEIAPASADTATGGRSGNWLGSDIIGNVECYASTIAEIKGSAPIVTEGVVVTVTGLTNSYSVGNHDNAKGLYYAEWIPLEEDLRSNGYITGGANARYIYTNNAHSISSYAGIAGWPTANVAAQYGVPLKIATAYDLSTGEYRVFTDQADSSLRTSYVGYGASTNLALAGDLSAVGAPTGPLLLRNVQRWHLPYTEAEAKKDELMG